MTHLSSLARLTGFAALLLATAAHAAPDAVELAQSGDDPAWAITEDLTTEIGPRPAGSDREAAARRWAVDRLKAMGFANVREEAYQMPVWQRGAEEAWLTAPFLPQRLTVVGLGNSGAWGMAMGFYLEILIPVRATQVQFGDNPIAWRINPDVGVVGYAQIGPQVNGDVIFRDALENNLLNLDLCTLTPMPAEC